MSVHVHPVRSVALMYFIVPVASVPLAHWLLTNFFILAASTKPENVKSSVAFLLASHVVQSALHPPYVVSFVLPSLWQACTSLPYLSVPHPAATEHEQMVYDLLPVVTDLVVTLFNVADAPVVAVVQVASVPYAEIFIVLLVALTLMAKTNRKETRNGIAVWS